MKDALEGIFMWAGMLSQWIGLLIWLRRFGFWRACGWYALSGGNFLIASVMEHDRWGAVWDAIWTAFYLWVWWNGGGGDKTKKRLKKLARKFSPVRRAAPQLT